MAQPLSKRLWLLCFATLVTAGCNCRPPGAQTQDSGEIIAECTVETDCALGQSCVDGRCVTPSSMDAATGCTSDLECPQGQRCLRSEGVCVNDTSDAGGELLDSGVIADCLEGETRSCGTSKLGECRLGTQTCEASGGTLAFGACIGAIDATLELCDGLDNDCDGDIDDGFAPISCGVGDCARTTESCVGGVPVTCAPGPASAEVCDGRDNDCDGTSDNGIANLTCGVGACFRSVAACVNGQPQSCIPGGAQSEICDGNDNDCNGATDDGLADLTCGVGQCARSVAACAPGGCQPGDAGVELCDGLDNDCDGLIDQTCACNPNATQGCYTGAPGTQGVGVCTGGTQTCSAAGQWGACLGQNTGSAELCNGLDDNCNGSADENLGSTPCGVGECATSVQNCVNGVAQTCTPNAPSAESCDSRDNNCDGFVDNFDAGVLSCGVGACANSVYACAGGVTQSCTPRPSSPETCNGIDDNCNGTADETFPQADAGCTLSGLSGPCRTGISTCNAGALGCAQTVFPSADVCGDGIDQNCDGIIDNGTNCGCTNMADVDFDGYKACVDCNDNDGTIHPDAGETCNGKDDNCNLVIDEGFDVDNDGFTTCGTKSGGGVDSTRIDCNDSNNFIFPLKSADCGNAATPNTANNVDDNCNGYKDETCSCSSADNDNDGYSACTGDCNDSSASIHPGATEVCNGKDDDCNRATIDNCGVSELCGERRMGSWQPWAAGTDQCRPDLICAQNVATQELRCGSYCNQTSGIGLNDSCQASEGCMFNLLYSTNLHLCGATTVGAKTAGQACTTDAECRSGDCRLDGTTSFCSDGCTHEAACGSSATCVIGLSQSSQMGVTLSNYYGYCRADSKITAVKTLGQTCAASECRTGAYGCFNGACAEPCCSNTDCGSGYVCSVNGPKIASGYQTGGVALWSVVPVCLATTASSVRVSGAACTTSSDCKSGICEKTSGICIDVCCNDTSCANGTTCEPTQLKLSTGQLTEIRACVFSPVPALIEQK